MPSLGSRARSAIGSRSRSVLGLHRLTTLSSSKQPRPPLSPPQQVASGAPRSSVLGFRFSVLAPTPITKHLNNIYNSGELDFESTCSILERMGNDGKQRYQTKYYNLDAILSVGYRHIWKKRTQQLIDAVASGRLLILSPWMHEPHKRTITRAECVALNQMAEEISASH